MLISVDIFLAIRFILVLSSYVLPIHAIVHFDGLVHRREHDQSSIDQNRAPIAICFDCFHGVGNDNQIRIFAPADESLPESVYLLPR